MLYNKTKRFNRLRRKVVGKKLYNQKGLTLLEVLLSIVLLVIVLTSFAGFFSQSALFVNKNEDKINTTQTAQQMVNLIELKLTRNILVNNGCASLPCSLNQNELSMLLDNPIDTSLRISADFTNSVEGLIRVKVSVENLDNPESSSKTFTYIRR
ncbi:prepilin-type N-terminal cleavage/methylation domain-containing protein [Mesobacillus subterraneus]|uniref:Prepilin-type N-terminal cleavage/methylation domain-containing protein n=1 Tax=Mesobacillus subterraneus TaxID=285983 RepID=A0A3R9DP55_9BACI|nr:prepilin-type N-terminal cleavage/methylation domain-containing protein [Mesobacillus subterraneus]